MPADWSRPVDVERLADAGERRENDLPLASLPRLAPDLAMVEGTVHARIEFARERKQPVADIEVRARLPLRCQRCMQPMWLDVDQQSRVWLVSDPTKVDRDEMGLEPILAPEGHIALRDLVEEELLLAVPLVPRHEDASDCTTGTSESEEEEVVQRPFAGLGELLKRKQ
ncbi:MAG: YceD family protein [Steroidobacteraceae bacterium]